MRMISHALFDDITKCDPGVFELFREYCGVFAYGYKFVGVTGYNDHR